jgi:actin-like ATPase involved in cell morphogenesis
MDRELTQYVIRYYGYLMTEREKCAYKHLWMTGNITHGRTDATAQAEAARDKTSRREALSEDPKVLALAEDGIAEFVQRTAERIMSAHEKEIYLNLCPSCGRIAKTPRARQCRFCHHDWHTA